MPGKTKREPCPFCGMPAVGLAWFENNRDLKFGATCGNPLCEGYVGHDRPFNTARESTEDWNRRAIASRGLPESAGKNAHDRARTGFQ